jgi:hypothetical protein
MSHPHNAFTASFLGLGTLVPGSWEGGTEGGTFLCGLGRFAAADVDVSGTSCCESSRMALLVRPEALSRSPGAGLREVRCRVDSRLPRPAGAILRITLQGGAGGRYPAELTLSNGRPDPADSWRPGDDEVLWLDSARCQVLPN